MFTFLHFQFSEVTEILEFDLRKVPLITENYELDKKNNEN